MKLLLNGIMSLCLFAGILFGLHLTNIITLKLPTMQNETGDNQLASGFLDDSQSEEGSTDSGLVVDNLQEEMTGTQALNYPYPSETAKEGAFVALGNTADNKAIFVYKIKLGGNIGGVILKRNTYSKDLGIPSKLEPVYVDANGIEISTGEEFSPGQRIFVELSGYTLSGIINTTGNSGAKDSDYGKKDTLNTTSSESVLKAGSACSNYEKFFQCVLKSSSGTDLQIFRNQLNAYFRAIKGLSESEQDAKCSNLIYEIKSKSTSGSQIACLDILK